MWLFHSFILKVTQRQQVPGCTEDKICLQYCEDVWAHDSISLII